MQPLVTIITPLTGGPERRENLRSWVSKIHNLAINLVLVHDENDPETRKEVSEIAALLPNHQVKVVHGFFGSPGGARNAGLELVESEWVVFWDSDDVGEPENLLRVIEANLDSSVIICAFTKNSDFEPSVSSLITIGKRRDTYLQLANQGGLWRYVMKKEFIKDLRFSHNKMGEDQQFIVGLNLYNVEVRKSDTVVYHYFYGADGHLTSNRQIQGQVELTLDAVRDQLIKQNRKFDLFETAIYFKLFLSVCKYSQPSKKISAINKFLLLVFIKGKVDFRHLVKIFVNLLVEYKENLRAS